MKLDRRLLLAILLPGLVLLVWTGTALLLVGATLDSNERESLVALLESRVALVLMLGLVLAGGLGYAASRLYRDRVEAPARLLEETRIVLSGGVQREVGAHGSPENQGLARAVNDIVAQRLQLQQDVEARVREASQRIEQERSRLAALMSELTQSVVVCNLDGRVLLYNNRARLQFRALSEAPGVAGGAELIGLGRSIYAVFDRKLVAHALESVQQRLQRGAASPSAQFVTTHPCGSAAAGPDGAGPVLRTGRRVCPGTQRLRAHARQHHPRIRGRKRARPPAARTDRAQPLIAGQHAGGAGHAGVSGSGRGDARALSRRDPRRDRRHEPAHPGPGRQFNRRAQDPLAAWKTCWAPTSWPRRLRRIEQAHQLSGSAAEVDAIALAQGGQLFAAAGAGLPGRPSGR